MDEGDALNEGISVEPREFEKRNIMHEVRRC